MEGASDILLERESERLRLTSALTDAADAHGRLVVIEGEAGIGKTAILEEATRQAERRAFHVLAARGAELEREFPYGVARQLFEGEIAQAATPRRKRLLAGAAGLAAPIVAPSGVPAASPAATIPDPFAAQHGLYWLAANLAAERPLALVVDDVHWADHSTLAWLGYLARRLEGVALLLVVATRTGEEDELLRTLITANSERLRPTALAEASVAALIGADLQSEPDPEFARACRDLTGGNPFLVTELGSELAAAGVEPTSEAVERLQAIAPVGIRQSVLLRLARLSDDAAALARAVCVLGEAQIHQGAALARLDSERAGAAADVLAGAAILAPGVPLRFRHPLLRTAIERDVGDARLATEHARAARLLSENGAPPERIAAQLLESELVGEEWAVTALHAAASAALARGAPGSAAAYLRRALAEPGASSRPDLLRELGRAEALAFSPEATEHLQAALALARDEGERGQLARELALALWQTGRTGEAGEALRPLLDGGVGPAERRLWLQAERGGIALFSLDAGWNELDPSLERAASGLAGATAAERAILVAYAGRLAQRGEDAARLLPILRNAIQADVLDELPPGSNLHAAAGFALLAAGANDEVVECFERDLARAREAGSRFGAGQALNMLAMARHRMGELAEAHALADGAIAIARDVGIWVGLAATLATLLYTCADRGLIDLAWEELERDGLAGEVPESFNSSRLLEGRGRVRLAADDAEGALADLLVAGELYRRWGVTGPGFTTWRSYAAEALVALGRHTEAAELAAEDVELAERAGVSRALGIAVRVMGLTRVRSHQLETLRRAVDVLAGSGARLEHARALCEWGAALRRQNRRREAREPLRAALELAERCGAQPLAERCRGELRAAGARARSIVRFGVDALSPAELRVCELAAAGRSNPEIAQALFVTRGTVESELHSAYRKLDIRGRTELAGALARGREVVAAQPETAKNL